MTIERKIDHIELHGIESIIFFSEEYYKIGEIIYLSINEKLCAYEDYDNPKEQTTTPKTYCAHML